MFFQSHFDYEYMMTLKESWRCDYMSCFSFHIDHLHNYFMSSRDKDERLLLLKNFLKTSFPKGGRYCPGYHEFSGCFVKICEYVLSSFYSNVQHLLTVSNTF